MKRKIKATIRQLIRRTGFDVVRYKRKNFGIDPFSDMRQLLAGHPQPVIFDVGANIGQSVDKFRLSFPQARIHSFEPSPATYARLNEHCTKAPAIPNVKTWNYGVGSSDGTLKLIENSYPDMSSFLAPGKSAWGKIVKTTEVPVVTLDSFTKSNGIDFIHLLKSDTQGYDLEVFKGAKELFKQNKVGLIYFECTFSEMYEGLPPIDQILRYLLENNFSLVAFYEFHFQNQLAGWTDALFINREFNRKRLEQAGKVV